MLYLALTFVAKYAGQIPYGDDYNDIAVYAGAQPVSLAWLWEQDYEWREALPKLIFVLLGKLSGFDLRVPLFFNALLLGLLAFALIRGAEQLRGFPRFTDAFFPLALLNWGHTRPLLHNHYLIYAVSVALLIAVLLVIVRHPEGPSLPAGLSAALCLIGLPLCGAIGVAVTPPLILWLGYAGARRLKRGDPLGKRDGAWLLSLAALAAGFLGLYFAGYQRPPEFPHSPGVAAALTTGAKFLSMSIGPFGRVSWPFSAVGVMALSLVGIAALLAAWRERPQERVRTVGLLLFIGAMGTLAFSVGIGRSGVREDYGFMDQYVTGAVPVLCLLYLIWDVAGAPRAGRAIQIFLFSLMLVLLPYNARRGLGMGNALAERKQALMEDVRAGLQPKELAARHWPKFTCREARMARQLELMRHARYGLYKH